jgi:hypothetical protein
MILSNDIDYIHDMHAIARERIQDVANDKLNDALDALHAGNVRGVLMYLSYAYLYVGDAIRIANDTTDILAE